MADSEGGTIVNDPLTVYRRSVAGLEPCADHWFDAALGAARAGDDDARRRIVGSCLPVALKVVERKHGHLAGDELLGLIETANNGLWASVLLPTSLSAMPSNPSKPILTSLGLESPAWDR
jgi:hypothetical protein